jgi:hypothetical protein
LDRKPYTVENMRPRRTVHLYGRTLAPKGRGRTSCMDLSVDEFHGQPCQRLLALNRLRVVRGGEAEVASSLKQFDPEPAKPENPPAEVKVEDEAPPAPAPLLDEPDATPSDEEPLESEDDGTTPPDPLQDLDKVWTEAELKELLAADQKVIIESRGLDGGTNAKSRIQAILDAQGDL